ncbi:MAG: hypothetical protein KatS3mg105_3296 [Gemmatales bacterium]|nr:MAG: hypothetical protein KatS3mg105_3296 [Gemmatales bacterium]
MAREIQEGSIKQEVLLDRHCSQAMALQRSKLAQRVLGIDHVPLTRCRVWDALHTNLPGTPAADDLGLVTGTLGTDAPRIETGDLKAAGPTTRYCRFQVALPEDYEAGETINLVVYAGMRTTVADVSATLDAEAYLVNKTTGGVGSDLVTTSAIDINQLNPAKRTFTINPSGLVAGDLLDIRLAIAINDAATATAVIGVIAAIELHSDRR